MPTMTAHTVVQNDYHLDIPQPRPGIYLDGGTGTMLDIGNNTTVANGQILLTNNLATVYGRGNGTTQWLKATTSAPTVTIGGGLVPTFATTTVRIRYNSLDVTPIRDWGPMGYFVADENTVSTEWEWNTHGTAMKVVVYRCPVITENGWMIPEVPMAERIKKIIAARCAPNYIRDRRALDSAPDIREIRARQTLRRVIGDDKFQDFIKKGFVSVRGKSGKHYQIFPGHGVTSVYFRGKMVERLCVVMVGNFPPTDSLIMRYLLILNNEDQFRSLANVSGPTETYFLPKEPDKRSLVEIFAAFKKQMKAA